ncbi:hypothetical protein J4232_00855 [Candidatus Woesearchaeota archaeon]|nr:hypothetical protein [Candidatus Woesearchaeota archaeon]
MGRTLTGVIVAAALFVSASVGYFLGKDEVRTKFHKQLDYINSVNAQRTAETKPDSLQLDSYITKKCPEAKPIETIVEKIVETECVKDTSNLFPNLETTFEYKDSYFTIYASNIKGHEWKFYVPLKLFHYYKMKRHDRVSDTDITHYVTYDDATIKHIATSISNGCKTNECTVNTIMKFVHQQLYDQTATEEEDNKDYIKYPIETLVERSGDCEDLAILAAALMKAKGIDVALLNFYSPPGEKSGHMAVGVVGKFNGTYFPFDGRKYYYTEATGTNWLDNQAKWKVGTFPDSDKYKTAHVYVIE